MQMERFDMLTLYHSPQTRSSRVVWLLDELDALAACTIKKVTIARSDGSSTADPNNPHPEGKVPVLDHDGVLITESGAIMLYLTDMFPQAGLGRDIGDPQRGAYLNWLHYYGGVIEPVLAAQFSDMDVSDLFKTTFRSPQEMGARLATTLEETPYLLGDRFSAADLLIVAPFTWFPAMAPDHPAIQGWIERCAARPAYHRMNQRDAPN